MLNYRVCLYLHSATPLITPQSCFDPFSGDAQRRVHRDHSEYGGKGSLCSCGGPGEICGDVEGGFIMFRVAIFHIKILIKSVIFQRSAN